MPSHHGEAASLAQRQVSEASWDDLQGFDFMPLGVSQNTFLSAETIRRDASKHGKDRGLSLVCKVHS